MKQEIERAHSGWTGLLGAAVAAAALGACTVPRERPAGGVHPDGWSNEASPSFHGAWLEDHGYPLADCRVCHGDDYAGGPVGSSCLGGCHTEGVEACDTCHGGVGTSLPATGAHEEHAAAPGFPAGEPALCGRCHLVPADARGDAHPDGTAAVTLSGVGALDPAARWDAAAQRCASVYCHGGAEVAWDGPPLDCGGCHAAPPPGHARWMDSAAPAPAACASCHPIAPDARHIDGAVDVLDLACDACHGKGPLGAPPPALGPGPEGAHRRHLDETLPDRIGAVTPCAACHPVPASIDAPQHLDASTPADVTLPAGGAYDAATGACVVGCHWDRSPGPLWSDSSGAARACDACHGFPPAATRAGTAHPSAAPSLGACLPCHPYEPARHVDGHVDVGP